MLKAPTLQRTCAHTAACCRILTRAAFFATIMAEGPQTGSSQSLPCPHATKFPAFQEPPRQSAGLHRCSRVCKSKKEAFEPACVPLSCMSDTRGCRGRRNGNEGEEMRLLRPECLTSSPPLPPHPNELFVCLLSLVSFSLLTFFVLQAV